MNIQYKRVVYLQNINQKKKRVRIQSNSLLKSKYQKIHFQAITLIINYFLE